MSGRRTPRRTPRRNGLSAGTPIEPRSSPRAVRFDAALFATVDLLNDLSRFCAVGTLEIDMPRRAAAGMEAPDDWLWLETPSASFPKNSLLNNLTQLAHLNVLRCTYKMVGRSTARVRVYLLPDDVGRGFVRRDVHEIKKFRREIILALDTSESGWRGLPVRERKSLGTTGDDHLSLFYLFNTLESPKPNPQAPWIRDFNTKELMKNVLRKPVKGMKNRLYEYQKRTVAMMLQRELAPESAPDPRFRLISCPTGQEYYLDLETAEMLMEPRKYEDVRGGILAEDTGTGKTFICLALILATKYQYSFVPEEYEAPPRVHSSVPSLMDLSISCIWKNVVPWREWKEDLSLKCINNLEASHGFYEVPPVSRSRSKRYSTTDVKEKIYLGTGTIVVCPSNLVDQWKREISVHVEQDALKVLVLVKSSDVIPPATELREYDLVIFARTRFDMEEREGKDNTGRREPGGKPLICRCPYKGATRIAACVCFDKEAVYKSPLMSIRWKRLIVDEGHSMASSSSLMNRGVCVAQRLPAERRWIVSATPVTGLLGVSAGMNIGETEETLKARREKELEERRVAQTNEADDLERLGRIVCDFLRVRPWGLPSESQSSEHASWKAYIGKGFMQRRPGSTSCVRNILQRLMLRHRLEDIEVDIILPPLYHTPVYLEPGFFERLSMNLFLAGLASNAVTSERTDQDYMFHPKNRASLRILTNNLLKQSGFYWVGHKPQDIELMIQVSQKCLQSSSRYRPEADLKLLDECIKAGQRALGNPIWRASIHNGEMAYSVLSFPEGIADEWALVAESGDPLPMGGKSVQDIQRYVNAHAYEPDLVSKLGNKSLVLRADSAANIARRRAAHRKTPEVAPNSPLCGEAGFTTDSASWLDQSGQSSADTVTSVPNLKSAMKPAIPVTVVPEDSPLAKTKIVGTSSRKLTYLLDKVLQYHETEKILIFYESDDVAFYIAQGLEIIGVNYLAYQKNLPSHDKARYLVTFQLSEKFRVFLMDLSQAAFGLNISTASRVFFVNPVWQPSVEHQALARAHRIGQKKPVYAETLVLDHTIERDMWDRRQKMTAHELNMTKGVAVNDSKMRKIISNTNFLKSEGDGDSRNGFANLEIPQTLLGPGKHGGIYDRDVIEDSMRRAFKETQSMATTVARVPEYLSTHDDDEVVSDLVQTNKYTSPSSPRSPTRKRKLSNSGSPSGPQKRSVRFL